MAAPSRYNRKLKAKNDRRKAAAARGGRTPSEAGLAKSMAASGRKVSKSNQRVGAPASKPRFGTPRAPSPRTPRPRKGRRSSVDPALRPNAVTGLSEEAQRKTRIVDEDGRDLSTLRKAGQIAEIASLAPVGGGGGLAVRGLVMGVGKAAPKAVRGATVATKAAKSGKAGSKAKKALKTAPKKAKAKAKATGKKAKRTVATKEGRRQAGKAAAKAPVKVARRNPAVATGAYSVGLDEAGVGGNVTRVISEDTKGVIDAVNSPSDVLKTAKTTGRAVPGILAGLVATGAAGATTVGRAAIDNVNAATGGRVGRDYTPEQVFSPITEEVAKNIEGTKQIAEPFIKGDREGVKGVVQDELGFLPIVASPRVISGVRNSRAAQGVRQGVRAKAKQRRERNNEEVRQDKKKQTVQRGDGKQKQMKVSAEDSRFGGEYAMPRVGRLIEGRRQRGEQSKNAARAKSIADVKTARILRTAEKSFRAIAVPKGKDAGDYRRGAKNAMATVLAYGIPRDYDRAVQWMDDVERGIAMPDNPPKISDKGNFEFLRNNPELFRDENFWKARDYLAKEQDSITTSEVKRYLAAGASLGIRNPDERLAEGVTIGGDGPKLTKEEAATVLGWAEEGLNGEIGKALRSGRNSEKASELLSATAKQPRTKKPMTLFRRVPLNRPLDDDLDLADPLVPGVGRTRTFLSTTKREFNSEAAANFEVAEIRLPAGSQVLDVEANLGRNPFSESEVILPPGTTLRWVDETADGRLVYEAITPDLPAPPGRTVIRERGRKEDQQLQRDKATLKNLRAGLRAAEKRGDMEEVDRLAPMVARKEKQLRDFTRATRKAQKEFVEETRGAMDARGLETPTFVRSWGDRTEIGQAAPFPASGVLAQRTWIDRDTTRKKGESERAWDDFVRDSIYKPRAQRIYHDLVSEFASSNAIRLPSARGTSVFLTRAEIVSAIKDGLIGPKDHVAFHSQHFRSAVQDPAKIDTKSGIGAFFELDDDGRKALAALDQDIRDRAADSGDKYIVVPKAGAEELVKQFVGPGKGGLLSLQTAANVNRIGSRIILGYNPSWAVAQLVAEGVPAAVAIGANPARWRRMRQATKERRNNPEQADLFDGTAGQTAGTTVIPKREQGVDTRGGEIATSGPVTAPGQVGQFILDTLKGEKLGQFDRLKGGGFRKMVLAAQIDKEVNGFLRGFGNYLKLDDQVRRKMKGMSPAEQQAYLLRNPKTAKALENYLDDVMGNWRAISSNERLASSLVAFYPYVRYALKSAFWGFPKRHPIKSSILYFLAQLNANQLEELVNEGTPVEWIDYAFPVISMDGKQKVTPGAARVAPALSVVTEAIGTQNFGRVFGGLNPLVGVGFRTATGTDFTGEKVAQKPQDNLLLGLAALTSMMAPYRILSEELDPMGEQGWSLRSYTPRRSIGEGGQPETIIGGRSTTSKALREVDVDRGLPSLINPFQTLDDQDFAERKRIIDALNRGAWRELPGSATADSSSSPSSSSSGSSSGGIAGYKTFRPGGFTGPSSSSSSTTSGGIAGYKKLSP